MGTRLTWADNNLAEDGHRIYRSESTMDPNDMPTALGSTAADVSVYDDGDSLVDGTTYYYRVGAYVGGVERISDEISIVASEVIIPVDGLRVFYTMDNISGSSLIDEEGNQTGIISGAIAVSGKLGNALEFDGSNDLVNLGSGDNISAYTEATISFWWKTSGGSGNYSSIIGNLSSNSNGYAGFAFQVYNTTGIRFFGIGNDLSVDLTFALDTWVHVVGVWDGSSIEIYKDSVSQQTRTLSTNNFNSSQDLLIGKLPYASLYAQGLVDHVRIYNRALDSSEVTQLYEELS